MLNYRRPRTELLFVLQKQLTYRVFIHIIQFCISMEFTVRKLLIEICVMVGISSNVILKFRWPYVVKCIFKILKIFQKFKFWGPLQHNCRVSIQLSTHLLWTFSFFPPFSIPIDHLLCLSLAVFIDFSYNSDSTHSHSHTHICTGKCTSSIHKSNVCQ